MDDNQAGGVPHIGTLDRGGDAGGRAPEEGIRGAVRFYLWPYSSFEGGGFGTLFLDYGG